MQWRATALSTQTWAGEEQERPAGGGPYPKYTICMRNATTGPLF